MVLICFLPLHIMANYIKEKKKQLTHDGGITKTQTLPVERLQKEISWLTSDFTLPSFFYKDPYCPVK